jgi:tetrahydromethanopterin S-methyltransferase subunit H
MATQIVMDHTGDTRHIFDENDAQALLKAEERFKKLTGAGFTAAIRTASGEAAVTHRFDPTAEETLFVPRLVGG